MNGGNEGAVRALSEQHYKRALTKQAEGQGADEVNTELLLAIYFELRHQTHLIDGPAAAPSSSIASR